MKTTLATSTWKPYTIVAGRQWPCPWRGIDDPFVGYPLVQMSPSFRLVIVTLSGDPRPRLTPGPQRAEEPKVEPRRTVLGAARSAAAGVLARLGLRKVGR
jgi:hypothetical protein